MDETTSNPEPTAKQGRPQGSPLQAEQGAAPSPQQLTVDQRISEVAQEHAAEHRQAYGTAKTENLRDSGLWRILLPGFVALSCLAVLAIPLIILVLLFRNTPAFVWIWATMLVIELGIAAVLIRGFVKIFLTQAGNYRS